MDFRRTNTVTIQVEEVEVVEDNRYLGVYLYNRLDWKCNAEAFDSKGQSRRYFLKKFRSFGVRTRCYPDIFYKSVGRVQHALQPSVPAAASEQETQ